MADIVHIATTTQASLNRSELLSVLEVLANDPPRIILEIGCHNGRSLQVWQDAFSPDLLLGIENHPTRELEGRLKAHDNWVVLFLNSQAASTVQLVRDILNGRQLDLLFLDGDHHLDAVYRDFLYYSPMVRSGGWVVFDDAAPTGNPTVEVSDFLSTLSGWHLITSPTGPAPDSEPHGMAMLRM